MKNEVLKFISHFKGSEETFLNGCCYWFAYILQERFQGDGYLVDIFHDPIEGHFVARFIPERDYGKVEDEDIRFFDIRGDVTRLYKEKDLEDVWLMSIHEERRWKKLMYDCRELIEPEDYPYWLKE